MPFSTPLPDLPSFPTVQSTVVTDTGRPDVGFRGWLRGLQVWCQAVTSALAQTGTTVTVVGSLPVASTCQGARYTVTDSNSTTFMATVATGGANIVPVFSNGTVWKIG